MLIFFITTISETLWFQLSSLSMNSIFVAWKSKIANKLKFAVKTAVPFSEDLTSNSYTLFQKPYNWNNDGFLLWISYIEELAYWEKSACNSNVLLVIFRTAVYSNLGLWFYISVFYTNDLLTEALLSYFSYFIFHELQIPYRIVNNTNGSKYSFGKQHHDKYLFQLCTPTYYGYRIIGESAWGGGGSVKRWDGLGFRNFYDLKRKGLFVKEI